MKIKKTDVVLFLVSSLILGYAVISEFKRRKKVDQWANGCYAAIEKTQALLEDAWMNPEITAEEYYRLYRQETDFLDIITHNGP